MFDPYISMWSYEFYDITLSTEITATSYDKSIYDKKSDLGTLQSNLQHSFNKLQKWCIQNRMLLNAEKHSNKSNANNYLTKAYKAT